MKFERAKRQQAKLRIGVFGPSGSGKTKGALRLARGLCTSWDEVGVIDTEHNSANLYAHMGDFNTLVLEPPFSPERYIEAISAGIEAGLKVLIIDSISHEWEGTGGILEIMETLTGNSYTNWGKVTPRHNKFINTILQAPIHMICCGRTKNDVVLSKNDRGKDVPEKVGIKAVTREGFDYEMTLAFDLSKHHIATTSKDRTELFMGKPDLQLTEKMGQALAEWADSGEVDMASQVKELIAQSSALFQRLGWSQSKCVEFLEQHYKTQKRQEMSLQQLTDLVAKLEQLGG